MEQAVATIRFLFSANKDSQVDSVCVRWEYEDTCTDKGNLQNILGLNPLGKMQFINDLEVVGRPGQRILFQFIEKFENGTTKNYNVDSFTAFNGVTFPLEICERETSENPSKEVTLRFKINYFTYFGQNLYIVGSTRELGFWDTTRAFQLSHSGSVGPSSVGPNQLFSDRRYNWQRDLVLHDCPASIQYRYFCSDGKNISYEPEPRMFRLNRDNDGIIELNDIWRWKWMPSAAYSTRFFSTIFAREQSGNGLVSTSTNKDVVKCFFRASAAGLPKDRSLRIVGSIPELGLWNEAKGFDLIPMQREIFKNWPSSENLAWYYELDIPSSSFPFEYKFVAATKSGNSAAIWEISENRVASVSNLETKAAYFDSWVINFPDVTFHGSSVFFSFGSVREQQPVCTFSAISQVGDWASVCGFSHVQIAQIFDRYAMTTKSTHLPVSGYALNPVFLDMKEYGFVGGSEDISTLLSEKLNFIGTVVIPQKAHEYEKELLTFTQENEFWLNDYIKHCNACRKLGSPDLLDNSDGFVCKDKVDESFRILVTFTQFLCYKQVKENIERCASKNIAVGIDLPFALSEYSAEVFFLPQIFMKDYKLGSAPTKENHVGEVFDAFPYNMEQATPWFTRRMTYFGLIFTAIRLESTINYFTQWVLPKDKCVRSIFGRYEPSSSISTAELETWGLWDIERYSRPYIHQEQLDQLFGSDSWSIQETFLQHTYDGNFGFKEEFKDEYSLKNAQLEGQSKEFRDKYLDKLLRLQGEVLLIKTPQGDFTPRPALCYSPDASDPVGTLSFSYSNLAEYEQNAISRLDIEFMQSKQKTLWASYGRNIIAQIRSMTQALILSDAPGFMGEICDEVMQNLTIVPLRVQTEGKNGNLFDDIRSYQFFSIAAPAKNSDPPLSYLWDNDRIQIKKLWEEEFWESGSPPMNFNSSVAETIMKQHGWSASMLEMFPLDTLYGSTNHIVHSEISKYGALNLPDFLHDETAQREIIRILTETKRRN